jgi:NAD-dependent dihydropyrimidine dehydrogenase PreA subunit
MAETIVYKDYLGIPRMLIPWYPTIDEELCNGCGLCVEACKHGTYAYSKNHERVIVSDPYCCEVYCESCRFQCPVSAISFPDRRAIKIAIKELRPQYPATE